MSPPFQTLASDDVDDGVGGRKAREIHLELGTPAWEVPGIRLFGDNHVVGERERQPSSGSLAVEGPEIRPSRDSPGEEVPARAPGNDSSGRGEVLEKRHAACHKNARVAREMVSAVSSQAVTSTAAAVASSCPNCLSTEPCRDDMSLVASPWCSAAPLSKPQRASSMILSFGVRWFADSGYCSPAVDSRTDSSAGNRREEPGQSWKGIRQLSAYHGRVCRSTKSRLQHSSIRSGHLL